MTHPTPAHFTLDDWIAREAIPFSIDTPRSFNAAVDAVIASLGDSVELLGFGFDSPTEMTGAESPGQVLHFVLDYLAAIDRASAQEHRERIDPLLGQDADWENPATLTDPTKSVGLSPAVTALRIATEELISELRVRRPELVATSDTSRYLKAAQYASMARQLLNYHAALARESSDRIARLLGIRDALMADNLAYLVASGITLQ